MYLHLDVEVGDLPLAGGRPRLGLELGGCEALAILVTMSLRTQRISVASVDGPVGAVDCRRSGLWVSTDM